MAEVALEGYAYLVGARGVGSIAPKSIGLVAGICDTAFGNDGLAIVTLRVNG